MDRAGLDQSALLILQLLPQLDVVDNAEHKGASPLIEFAAEGATTFSY